MRVLKYILQLGMIMVFLFIGNGLSELISKVIIIPGSIIGMLLLFFALITKLIPLSMIEETSQFFLKHMGFFFIPLGVSLIESYMILQTFAIQLIVLLIVSNMLVMGMSAKITEKVMRKQVKHD